jgi:hypothetical protein
VVCCVAKSISEVKNGTGKGRDSRGQSVCFSQRGSVWLSKLKNLGCQLEGVGLSRGKCRFVVIALVGRMAASV